MEEENIKNNNALNPQTGLQQEVLNAGLSEAAEGAKEAAGLQEDLVSQTTPAPQKTITAEQLKEEPKLKLPDAKPEIGAGQLVTQLAEEAKSSAEKRQEQAVSERETSMSEISKLVEEISLGEAQGAVKTDEQFALEEQKADIDSRISLLDRGLKTYIDSLYQNPQLTQTLASRLSTEQTRKVSSEMADLALVSSILDGKIDRAEAIGKAKVEAELAPAKAELAAKKFVFDSNEDIFTANEKEVFKSSIRREEKKIENEQKEKENFENAKVTFLSNAALTNADQKTMDGITSSKNSEELFSKYGKFLASPIDRAKLRQLNLDNQKTVNEINAAKEFIGGTTGDAVLDIITGSARYGDKRINDSQLEKIQQAEQALGGLESLQGILMQGEDGLNLTGPVVGRTRKLLTELGGDTDAKAINAIIQGLIPTVARGIFGEVGVLTDADINNYKKTLPNLTSTEDQNKAVSIIMYDVLSRSLQSTLTTNAQNQANVSGFASTYIETRDKINQLKSEIGITPGSEVITEENRVKMDNAWNESKGLGQSIPAPNITPLLDNLVITP